VAGAAQIEVRPAPGEVAVVEVREAPTNPTPKDKNLHPIPSIRMAKNHGILLKA
jgi:hypothetical protein